MFHNVKKGWQKTTLQYANISRIYSFKERDINWVNDLTTKPLKSSLPFGYGWNKFGQDASNASHKHEEFVGPSHACHGFLIQLVFHFSHVFLKV